MKNINDFLVGRTPLRKVKIQKEKQSSLFKPDFTLVQQERCPRCTQKLYWTHDRKLLLCHKKSCKFVLPKKSFESIVSGETLRDWKENDRLNRR